MNELIGKTVIRCAVEVSDGMQIATGRLHLPVKPNYVSSQT